MLRRALRTVTHPAGAGPAWSHQNPVRPADGAGGRLPPLGRAGQVSDVVDGVLFLESASYITGEILHVDGGQIAGHREPLG